MGSKDCCSSELKSEKEKVFLMKLFFLCIARHFFDVWLLLHSCTGLKKKIPERLNSNASFLLSVHFPQAAPLMQLPIRAGDAPLHLRVLSG